MKTKVRTLSDLHQEFHAKSSQLYSGAVNPKTRKQLIIDRQRIVREMWYLKKEKAKETSGNLRVAGAENPEFVNKLARKGVIFRSVG